MIEIDKDHKSVANILKEKATAKKYSSVGKDKSGNLGI